MTVILLTALVIQLKPPYKHTEAHTLAGAHINNSVQTTSASQQTEHKQQETPVLEQQTKPVVQETVKTETVPTVIYPTGCENYIHLLSKYDWNVNVMTQICQAESGGNPNAVGDTRVIGGIYAPSCGLFQIRTLAGRPDCETLKNPETNIDWAYKIYKGQGYPAWSVCKTKVSCY